MSEMIMSRLEKNALGNRSIEIYGGAYHLAKRENYNMEDIFKAAVSAIKNAEFFEPSSKPSEVARKFCRLLLVDPMLVEANFNFKWEDLD